MGPHGVSRTIAGAAGVATAVVTVLAAATSGSDAGQAGLRPYYHQTITWEHCGKPTATTAQPKAAQTQNQTQAQNRAPDPSTTPAPSAYVGRLQCGWLTVPRDYRNPAHAELRIRVERLPATGPGTRLGSLVTNPGGPGYSGVDFLAGSGGLFNHLNTRYDIVTFDPRGTGASAPVDCGTQGPPSRQSGGDVAALFKKQKFINDACEKHSGAILPWLGTTSSARDMDVLRGAVGDERLNYLGFSYGTKLGADYAHAFPGKVGRTVLDSVEDPTTNMAQSALAQVRDQQKALDAFADDCAEHDPTCPLGHTGAAARAQLQTWYDQLSAHPLKANGQVVDETTYVGALQVELYSQSNWPTLRTALTLLKHGDARGILLIYNLGEGGRSVAVARDPLPSQEQLAQRAIECRDTSERYDTAAFERDAEQLVTASPLFGPAVANPLSECAGWPVPGDDASRDVTARGAAPMLLVANTTDPATPYEGAAHMARALGNGDTVLTVQTSGHAAYTSDNTCVHQSVDGFLLHGEMPPKNTTCH